MHPVSSKWLWLAPFAWVSVSALITCGPTNTSSGTPPERFCPGGPGCERGLDGNFKVGVAALKVTPPSYERARPDFYRNKGSICSAGSPLGTDGQPRCGKLIVKAFDDCGLDTLCPGDMGYVAPDADGTESDGKKDFFFDCGRDGICPGDTGYTAPDADGTEGDGKFQGVWLAGFGTTRPAYSTHDDLWARAVSFQNGDTSIAMVAVDVVGLFYDDVTRIRNRVKVLATEAGLDIDYVLVAATHGHEGPDTEGQWGPAVGGLIPTRGVDDVWFNSVLVENTAQAVVQAAQTARKAKLYAAQGNLGDPLVNTLIKDEREPIVIDDTVTAMKFVDAANNEVIGSFMSWGNHPETLADTNATITSDYPNWLRETMEQGFKAENGTTLVPGLGGTALFFNGSLGGMMSTLGVDPKDEQGKSFPPRSYEKAAAIGSRAGKFALELLANAAEVKSPQIAFGALNTKIKVENELFQLAFQTNIAKRRAYDVDFTRPYSPTNVPSVLSEVAKVYIGPVRFLAVPGEPLPELAVGYDARWAFGRKQVETTDVNAPDLTKAPPPPYLKEQLGGKYPCIIGLANDHIGYLIPSYNFVLHPEEPYFEEASGGQHYEETNSVGPSATPHLLEEFGKLFAWQPYKETSTP